MIEIKVDKSIGRIILKTDDSTVKYLLEVTTKETKYIPWKKSWGTVTTINKIYDNTKVKPDSNGVWTFIIGKGWAAYLINVFRGSMSQEDFEGVLKDAIYSETYRTIPFNELRDYQNEDVLHILKYRIGLLSCYTSYGKTQTIATIANYVYSLGKTVLLVTPGKKAQDELVKRCKNVFNLDVPSKDGRINCIITSGLLNRKDIKDPKKLKEFENYLASVDYVLADEVEYTINDSGEFLYDRLINANNFYGFSGTADKKAGEMISFINGLSDVVIRNKDLIKYFGPSLVYRMPLNLTIDNIEVKTSTLDSLKFNKIDGEEEGNLYLRIMTQIWTDPGVCNLITKLIPKYPKLFIPINNLTNILSDWIDNYFIGKFRILLVCFEGYIYYDLDGNKTKLTLQEACDKIAADEVDVIPSTSSGYRALDFPGIENILLIQGNIGGVVLQAIGRVARGNHMNIISLGTKSGRKVPVYSKGDETRKELLKSYYKYCDMTDSIIYEENI